MEREPERRVLMAGTKGGGDEHLVTFTQVGWLGLRSGDLFSLNEFPTHPDNLKGSFAPVWVEGPNE